MFLPLVPGAQGSVMASYQTFQVMGKKLSHVGMKRAFLNAPWDFTNFLHHGLSSCCSPGEEEAAQSAVLCPPLVSQVGHAVAHALVLT